MSYIIVLMTASNKEEAIKIVRILLEEKLVACANMIEAVSSFYWWKGTIEEEQRGFIDHEIAQKSLPEALLTHNRTSQL